MNFNNMLDEAKYKMSSRTIDGASPYHSNPRFGGNGIPLGGSGSANGGLLAIAKQQLQILEEISKSITALSGQQRNQFEENKKRQFDTFQVNNRRIQQIASIGEAAARNSGSGVAVGSLNMAADVLPGVVGKLAGTFATLISATNMVVDGFLKRASELSGYSGSIAAAEANADIRRMMADIRESQALGDSYAKLIKSQVDLEMTIRENLLPIKQFLLETLSDVLKVVVEILKSEEADKVGKVLSFLGNAGMAGWNIATFDWSGAKQRFAKMDKNLEDIKNNTKKAVEANVNDIDLLGPALDPRPIDPMPNVRPIVDPQLIIPLLGL